MAEDNTAPITVMIVDDHPIWRDAVARDLADEGFNVVATAEGWPPRAVEPPSCIPMWW